MSDGVDLILDPAAIDREADKLVRRYLSAGTEAVAATTKDLERALEAATKASVPGNLWRAWTSRTDPKRGPARNPVGRVFVNGGLRSKGALTFWRMPGAIRGKQGQFLAIPLPAAGSTGRGRNLTPVEWEARHNIELRPVFRPGRAGLLVADAAVLSGRGQVARPNTARRIAAGRGSATVPIFVLVRMVKFGNAFSIEPLIAQAEQALVAKYLALIADAS